MATSSNLVCPPYRVKKKRARGHTGCVTCRARKVKCDEQPESCLNCQRLGVKCSGYVPRPLNRIERLQIIEGDKSSSGEALTQAGTRRIRKPESCKCCRNAKTKCSGEMPRCARCSEKKMECYYDTDHRRARNASATQSGGVFAGSAQQRPLLHVEPGILEKQAENLSIRSEILEQDSFHLVSNGSDTQNESYLGDYSWLCSQDLPNEKRIYELVDSYFANVHPLRCFGFIHKPTFMERLDCGLARGSSGSPLVHIMCALGSRFYVLDKLDSELATHSVCLPVGNAWADKAKKLLFRDLNQISVENLMVAVLLHDYQLRIGDYAAAFMLSGTTARMAQAMQINLEYSPDILCTGENSPLDASARETRRRLMWSCYVMDSWVGSGVDQLTLFQERDIKIQLPCNERAFLQQIPCVTDTLTSGQSLWFLPEELKATKRGENMGMVAQFVKVAEIRKRVLRYLKGIDITQSSKLPDNEFVALDTAFKQWHDALHPLQRLTTTNIYICKGSNQLGAFFLLHCAYHLSTCDLYRIGDPRLLPRFFRFHFSIDSLPEQQAFLQHCRDTCFQHAKKVANILAQAAKHGIKILADSWLCTAAYETIRIMAFYVMKDNSANNGAQTNTEKMTEVLPLLESNIKILRLMRPLFCTAESCHKAAICLLKRLGFHEQLFDEYADLDHPNDIEGPSITNPLIQVTPESVLNPLSIYSLARKGIEEKHTPELGTPVYSSAGATPDSEANAILPTTELYSHEVTQPFLSLQEPVSQAQQILTLTSDAPYVNSILPLSHEQPLLWQGGLDDYSMNFSAGLDYSWQWAETGQDGIRSRGFPPLC